MSSPKGSTYNSRNAPKFVIRFHRAELQDKIAELAAANRRSMNSEINEAIERHLASAEGEGAPEPVGSTAPVSEEHWIPQEGQLVMAPNGPGVIKDFVWRNMKVYAEVLLLGRKTPVMEPLYDLKPYKQVL